MPSPATDESLVEGVRSARSDALEAAYRTYAGPLLGWVRTQGVDHATAEEVVEQTFYELVRDCRSITGDGRALRAWLYQATRRNLTDAHRARQRDRTFPAGTVPERMDDDPSVDDQVAARTIAGPIADALQALSPAQREVVSLRYLADLSTAEVATVTGRSAVAVRQLLHSARRNLAPRLAGDPMVSPGGRVAEGRA